MSTQAKGRGGRRNNALSAVRAVRREIVGAALKPPGDPPSVSVQPWYPITAVNAFPAGSAGLELTALQLSTTVASQLGISLLGGVGLVMRIKSAKAWGPLGGSVEAVFFDFTKQSPSDPADYEMAQMRDSGTATSRPRVGYLWPIAQARTPISASAGAVASITASADTATLTGQTIVHTHLEWRLEDF